MPDAPPFYCIIPSGIKRGEPLTLICRPQLHFLTGPNLQKTNTVSAIGAQRSTAILLHAYCSRANANGWFFKLRLIYREILRILKNQFAGFLSLSSIQFSWRRPGVIVIPMVQSGLRAIGPAVLPEITWLCKDGAA